MREPVFLVAFMIAAGTVLMIVKTIAAAFTGRGSAQLRDQLDQQTAALDDLEARLAHQSAQIAELQERLDFAERLLAQNKDRAALNAPPQES